jgi:hypothetical protein
MQLIQFATSQYLQINIIKVFNNKFLLYAPVGIELSPSQVVPKDEGITTM